MTERETAVREAIAICDAQLSYYKQRGESDAANPALAHDWFTRSATAYAIKGHIEDLLRRPRVKNAGDDP
jgi:hypothetical protein